MSNKTTQKVLGAPPPNLWHKGPPPHIGWWNASAIGKANTFRWWNGREWSDPCLGVLHRNPDVIARIARTTAWTSSEIKWTHRWPENAIVPRIDPAVGTTIHKGRRWWITASGNLDSWAEPLQWGAARQEQWDRYAASRNAQAATAAVKALHSEERSGPATVDSQELLRIADTLEQAAKKLRDLQQKG